jgi:hypothetical protein
VRRGPADSWTPRQVADALGLGLAAQLRDDVRLDADLARGEPPGRRGRGALHRAAEQCLATALAARAA